MGATQNTEFGRILFEGDFLLKQLALGIDANGFRLLDSATVGARLLSLSYKSFAQRLFEQELQNTGYSTEFWFRPKHVVVGIDKTVTQEGRAFVFRDMAMEVGVRLLNSDGSAVQNPNPAYLSAAQAFASNLTQHYDAYAAIPDFEVLKKLKRLGKITAVVKWLFDSNIPVDLSFVSNYKPAQTVTTPTRATVLRSCPGATGGLSENGNGPYDLTKPFCPGIIGGIAYDKNSAYCSAANDFSSTNPCLSTAETELVGAAIGASGRNLNATTTPGLAWPVSYGGSSYVGLSSTVAPYAKDGQIQFETTDLAFPNQAGQHLALIRYHESFSNLDQGFGPGWSPVPYTLSLVSAANLYAANATVPPYSEQPFFPGINLVDRIGQRTVRFVPAPISYAGYPMGFAPLTINGVTVAVPEYISESGGNDVILDFEYVRAQFAGQIVNGQPVVPGRFFYFQRAPHSDKVYQTKGVWFNQLSANAASLWHADPVVIALPGGHGASASNGVNLYFQYAGEKLVAIRAQDGRTIQVAWTAGRIDRATFTSGDGQIRSVQYRYDLKGRLQRVIQTGGEIEYEYADATDPAMPATLRKVKDVTRGQDVMLWSGDMQQRARRAAPGDFPLKATAVEYDRVNGRTKSTSSEGTITQVTRDATGRLVLAATTGNVGGVTETISNTRRYNSAASRNSGPSQLIDARNNSSYIAYDAFGLPQELKQTGGDIPARIATVRRGVDASDNMPITVYIDPKSRASVVKYDHTGRPMRFYRRVSITSTTNCPGYDNVADKPQCFTYTVDSGASTSIAYGTTGAADNVSITTGMSVSRYPWIGATETSRVTERQSSGQINSVVSAAGYTTRYRYDGLSRLTSLQEPGAVAPTAVSYYETGRIQDRVQLVTTPLSTTEYSYDPQTRQDTVVDASGVATTRFYNQRSLLLRVVERAPMGGSITTTQFFYDSADRLIKTVMPNNAEVVYEYDGFGRVLKSTESDISTSSNVRPTVTSTLNPAGYTVTAGQSFQLDINATDANGHSLVYTLINPPTGMTIDNQTGLVRWIPSTSYAGAHDVAVQVIDNYGGIATVVFSLDVWPAGAADSDRDGVPDAYDILPNDARYARDRDADFQPDEWETAHNLVIGRNDAYEDADGDGLENLAEFQREADPNASDTDGDEMNDGDEVAIGRNPTVDEGALITILNSIQE